MNRFRSLMLLALSISAGCYRVTVITGAPPAPQTIDKEWQHSFGYGLMSPAEISTKEICPLGISKVQTERSFLNGLVSLITFSIYSPIHTTVTCASGPVVR